MTSRRRFLAITAGLASAPIVDVANAQSASQPSPLRILAAASLTESLQEAGEAFAARGHAKPVFSFAASSVLARQIERGAMADLFLSADEEWMDYLQARGLIERATRVRLLSNRLVLIAPADRPLRLRIRRGFDLRGALGAGRLAMADPDSVPAGRYGKAALEHLGVWPAVSGAVVRAENVRAALRFVEMGEAAAGVVYATDAQAAGARVIVVDTFPAESHPPISYPMAIVKGRGAPQSRAFARFLQSPQAAAIFRRRGFVVSR